MRCLNNSILCLLISTYEKLYVSMKFSMRIGVEMFSFSFCIVLLVRVFDC